MKFYLLKNCRAYVGNSKEEHNFKSGSWEGTVIRGFGKITGEIFPFEDTVADKGKCEKVKQLLDQATKNQREIELEIGVKMESTREEKFHGYVHLKDVCHPGILNQICVMSDSKATIQMKFERLVRMQDVSKPILHDNQVTSEMEIAKDKNGTGCQDEDLMFTCFSHEEMPDVSEGIFTITVDMPNETINDNYLSVCKQQMQLSLDNAKSILENEVLADVIITTGDGVTLRAHKVFLASQSSVFLTMFSSDMRESKESKVEIVDMSAESVRSFLKYLYYGDLSVTKGSMEQALEMYMAAHKYNVDNLERLMRNTIIAKSEKWFEVDTTIRLFVFAKRLEPADTELETRAVQVLKRFTNQLVESQVYQDLFKTNAVAAMELCKLALSSN